MTVNGTSHVSTSVDGDREFRLASGVTWAVNSCDVLVRNALGNVCSIGYPDMGDLVQGQCRTLVGVDFALRGVLAQDVGFGDWVVSSSHHWVCRFDPGSLAVFSRG